MKNINMREMLIDRTISVIADLGLDKTTTKAIVSSTDINEAYIYRFFESKEDLLSKAFEKLDNELFSVVMNGTQIMYQSGIEYEMRSRLFFAKVWRFLLCNREKCLSFIRYYYSPYFKKYSSLEHQKRYEPLVEKFKEAFRAEANTWMLLNHILNVMLDFAVKVYNDDIPDNDDTSEHVFLLVYNSIFIYFAK